MDNKSITSVRKPACGRQSEPRSKILTILSGCPDGLVADGALVGARTGFDFDTRATGKLQASIKTISKIKTAIFLDINLDYFFHRLLIKLSIIKCGLNQIVI